MTADPALAHAGQPRAHRKPSQSARRVDLLRRRRSPVHVLPRRRSGRARRDDASQPPVRVHDLAWVMRCRTAHAWWASRRVAARKGGSSCQRSSLPLPGLPPPTHPVPLTHKKKGSMGALPRPFRVSHRSGSDRDMGAHLDGGPHAAGRRRHASCHGPVRFWPTLESAHPARLGAWCRLTNCHKN